MIRPSVSSFWNIISASGGVVFVGLLPYAEFPESWSPQVVSVASPVFNVFACVVTLMFACRLAGDVLSGRLLRKGPVMDQGFRAVAGDPAAVTQVELGKGEGLEVWMTDARGSDLRGTFQLRGEDGRVVAARWVRAVTPMPFFHMQPAVEPEDAHSVALVPPEAGKWELLFVGEVDGWVRVNFCKAVLLIPRSLSRRCFDQRRRWQAE